MKCVVVGKGGREHALAKTLQSSALVTKLWVAPGNPGMAQEGLLCLEMEDLKEIESFCLQNKVDFVVLGPEAAILSSLKSNLEEQGIPVFAPPLEVAKLESSKLFCKEILQEAALLTASCQEVKSLAEAHLAIEGHNFSEGLVIKADGLAAGKGVWVCENKEQALLAVKSLSQQFGFPLLIEECLVGPELSAFALCDGDDFVTLGTACDYKRINADIFSANTGGMGAYSPCDFLTDEDHKSIHEIFSKTLKTLKKRGTSYQGFLFAGLMKTSKGLYVLEFNVRLGDPETQVLLPRMKTDLAELILKALRHELRGSHCDLSSQTAVHVVAASQGYPEAKMHLGNQISITSSLAQQIFFSGVSKNSLGLVNSGGRVLGVTALAQNKTQAREKAYEDLKHINFEGIYFRKDIGL